MKLMQKEERDKRIEEVGKRRAVLESAVQAVVQKYSPALFVWGPAGLGKSHVLTTLLQGMCGADWQHHTAYSTAKGLMLSLAERPESIHLFEDCERMLKTDLSASLLRAACGAPNNQPRWVTYETANERIKVNFTGGIIIATNSNLSRQTGPMQAVASRFRPMEWTLTVPERIAVIMQIAESGWVRGGSKVTPSDAKSVAMQLIEMIESGSAGCDLDLRLFTEHALPLYCWAMKNEVKNWQDLLLSKLKGVAGTREEAQHEKTQRLQTLACLIDQGAGKASDKVKAWKDRTGLGQAIYYRHLRAAKRK